MPPRKPSPPSASALSEPTPNDRLLDLAIAQLPNWVERFPGTTKKVYDAAAAAAKKSLIAHADAAKKIAGDKTLGVVEPYLTRAQPLLSEWRQKLRAHEQACRARAEQPMPQYEKAAYAPVLKEILISEAHRPTESAKTLVYVDLKLVIATSRLTDISLGGELEQSFSGGQLLGMDNMYTALSAVDSDERLDFPWDLSRVLDEPYVTEDDKSFTSYWVVAPANSSKLKTFERLQSLSVALFGDSPSHPSVARSQLGVITDSPELETIAKAQNYQCMLVDPAQ